MVICIIEYRECKREMETKTDVTASIIFNKRWHIRLVFASRGTVDEHRFHYHEWVMQCKGLLNQTKQLSKLISCGRKKKDSYTYTARTGIYILGLVSQNWYCETGTVKQAL